MSYARATFAYVSPSVFCLAACVAGCSNGSANTGAALPPSVVTGLQETVAQGQAYASTPTDPATLRVAAQLTELQQDREVQLGTAAMLLSSESDPRYAASKAKLEVARQKALALAAKDLSEIQSLQQSPVPGQAQLAADGGADDVMAALIAKTFASRAQSVLTLSSAGAKTPSADQLSDFLQEVAIVMGDDGAGGHNVAARLLARDILSDAGLATTDTGAP